MEEHTEEARVEEEANKPSVCGQNFLNLISTHIQIGENCNLGQPRG